MDNQTKQTDQQESVRSNGSMATEQQLKSLERFVDVIHEMMIDQLDGQRVGKLRQLSSNRHIFIRTFGSMLYEAPKLHTGKASVRLIEQKLNDFSSKPCLEHHHGRQKGGLALVNLIERAIATDVDPTKDQVREIVLQYCQVHYTTAYENSQLRKHQRNCSSEAAYRRTNIVLHDAPDLFHHRGKHSKVWKAEMQAKYGHIVLAYNNPPIEPDTEVEVPEYTR